jgi:hypothetical protein
VSAGTNDSGSPKNSPRTSKSPTAHPINEKRVERLERTMQNLTTELKEHQNADVSYLYFMSNTYKIEILQTPNFRK